ncbi:hypothetical protein [Chitinophaga tropicalis]|uniref:Uncharacterized protein n=1 Tax=Chitinophaga tropicalis TaxID=2683588 RepID=A0A7K1U6B3_9BACT|nr:hypothetical protein [Chitinophaga tropicalis]MVT09505.1 hypothetical protein [Chitinophaga tropicalis]
MKEIPISLKTNSIINRNGQPPLTPEKLRELSGLDIPDEEAQQIIHSIRLFCKVLYQFTVTTHSKNERQKENFKNTINIAA